MTRLLPVLALCLLLLPGCGDEPTPQPPEPPAPAAGPSPTAPPPPEPEATVADSPKVLMRLMKEISAAAVAGEEEKARRMCRALLLPDPQAWFDAIFGPEVGARLADEYAARAKLIDTLPAVFPELHAKGQTQMLVERHEDPKDPAATGYQSVAMARMKKPTRLYSVRFLEPDADAGFSLWSFVHVDGAFRFAGKMRTVNPAKRSPHAAMLGELRRRDAEKFLETGSFGDDK